MSKTANRPVQLGSAMNSLLGAPPPRVLITGACRGVGRACAEALAARGAELILCDNDAVALIEAAESLGAASRFCDVASEASVSIFAADILDHYASLDMVINAAGGGYERTLGMYRVSRALLPALRQGTHKLLINIPPSAEDLEAAIFPYASSGQAFQRLSAALASETRGTSVTVLIGDPRTRRLTQVLPDPNAGAWAEASDLRRPGPDGVLTMAWQIAALLGKPGRRRRTG
jgi:NAD(P)-dependent dehydrogenase (short-subunit alcohol dehydrogenase family)